VYAQTAIPAGTYHVSLTYAPKFKKMLPWIQNVPHFTGILIHNGNTAKDSAGCIIIGENTLKGCVLNSLKYVPKLVELIKAAGGKAIVEISNEK
jgi:hypothetical protein